MKDLVVTGFKKELLYSNQLIIYKERFEIQIAFFIRLNTLLFYSPLKRNQNFALII
jgi:hypothetical protein